MASSKPFSTVGRRVLPALVASDAGVLPLDAMYEILLRLLAKDLCRLRAVCRLWRSLLSSPQFIAAHGACHPEPLIIASYSGKHDVLVDIIDLSGQKIKKVLRKEEGDWVRSMALDLICVKNTHSGVYQLLNPATGSVYHLPRNMAEDHLIRGLKQSDYGERAYVFGQIARTREYKVLRVLLNFPMDTEDLFEICTLDSRGPSCWRAKQAPPIYLLPDENNIVVIDGTLYFLSGAVYFDLSDIDQEWIVPFDLETEKWRPKIKGPSTFFNDDLNRSSRQLTLVNLNGALVIVHGTTALLDLWFLTDIEKGLWVKQYSLQVAQRGHGLIIYPLMVLGDGKLVMRVGYTLLIHDPATNISTNILKLRHSFGTSLYTGNLLSLDGQKY